jgi:hypothetical protein
MTEPVKIIKGIQICRQQAFHNYLNGLESRVFPRLAMGFLEMLG